MKNLKLVAEQLEKYLNIAQEFTEDYHLTMELGRDPMRIISEESEKLKRIEAMKILMFVQMIIVSAIRELQDKQQNWLTEL
jgi:hypothetical protein